MKIFESKKIIGKARKRLKIIEKQLFQSKSARIWLKLIKSVYRF